MHREARPGAGCTVLIPAYNEAATIRGVVEGALAHAERVVVISDGSTDGSVAALAGLPVEIVAHAHNRGKGWRLAEGFDHAFAAGAQAVLTLDADGQHDPDSIPDFLAAAGAAPGCLVIGDRSADRASIPRLRAKSVGFGDFFISWATGRRVRDAQCGMRLYPAALWQAIRMPPAERAHFIFETAILLRAAEAGVPFVRVPVQARYAGFVRRRSHFRPILDTLRIVRAVTGFLARRGFRPRGLLLALGLLR
ncbi:MAG TPA: glycosyltransferase family 2 protein [Thermohalobaculum sp.]|nr:glycosyltransferase family 2 protein [Thermohalobaculum sp.]